MVNALLTPLTQVPSKPNIAAAVSDAHGNGVAAGAGLVP